MRDGEGKLKHITYLACYIQRAPRVVKQNTVGQFRGLLENFWTNHIHARERGLLGYFPEADHEQRPIYDGLSESRPPIHSSNVIFGKIRNRLVHK